MPLFFCVFSLELLHELVEDCGNLVDFLVCVTILYGRKNTGMQVRVQHFLVDLGQNRLTRQYLIADVYAILFVLYHFDYTFNLPARRFEQTYYFCVVSYHILSLTRS